MKKIRTIITSGTASLGLVLGLSGFAGAMSGTIDTTGPDSTNRVRHSWDSRVAVQNHNMVRAGNHNSQQSSSGEAEVEHNTTGGSAKSGNAANTNTLKASVSVDNSGAGAAATTMPGGTRSTGDISNTGPDSTNVVRTSVRNEVQIMNKNCISIENTNSQTAVSGDAEVEGNTTGGNATSGNATNTNSTTLAFEISN